VALKHAAIGKFAAMEPDRRGDFGLGLIAYSGFFPVV